MPLKIRRTDNPATAKLTRFNIPASGDVYWFRGHPQPAWNPHLIEIVDDRDPAKYQFKFVHRDGTRSAVQTIDLDKMQLVWKGFPSTLDPDTANPQAAGAILFLTENLESEDPGLYAASDPNSGTGKWPRGAGAGTKVFLTLSAADLRSALVHIIDEKLASVLDTANKLLGALLWRGAAK